jgi:tRNA pseudouridine38-40 synthase
MRLRLTLAYDGTDYHGWQAQPSVRTVQDQLRRALERLAGAPIALTGASRTDAGVHALGQVASLEWPAARRLERLRTALNALLPADLRVLETAEADPGFDARRQARWKAYLYLVEQAPILSPLRRRYVTHERRGLDLEAMRQAAGRLVGVHDFASYCAGEPPGKPTVRELRGVTIEARGTLLQLRFVGNSFLRCMVRRIVGTLLQIGRGQLEPAAVERILSARDRGAAGPTAAAGGLYLVRVYYAEDGPPEAARPAVTAPLPFD